MRLEYRVWNINHEWTPMKATTLSEALLEIVAMGPYGEEAVVRDADTGKVYAQNLPGDVIHGMTCSCCPRW